MAEPARVWDDAIRAARARFATVDEARLSAFIADQPDVRGPVHVQDLNILADGSGMSNGIAFFRATMDLGTGLATHDLVLRYDPGVSLIQQKSFADEFRTMRVVNARGLPVPEALWLDPDGCALGARGFIMRRVVGDTPASAMYSSGPFANVTPEARHAMMLEPAGFHARLRNAALGPEDVPHLVAKGNGATPFERELNWWLREAELITAPDDPRRLRVVEVRDWLLEHQPALRPATLIHGDAQHCNTIFRGGKPAGVLDWELAHLGYAETDIVMMVLTTEILKVTDMHVDGTPTEADYIARYEAESGEKVEHWSFFKVVMAYRYLIGQIFAAAHLPNAEEMWRMVDTMVRDFQVAALADRLSSN